jgi:uncharacterized protein (DUF433 family)
MPSAFSQGTRPRRVPSRDLEQVLSFDGEAGVSDKQKPTSKLLPTDCGAARTRQATRRDTRVAWRNATHCVSFLLGGGTVVDCALAAWGIAECAGIMDYSKIITIEPGKRSGKPCIRGMRITVSDVLEYFASGMTEADILNDFPELTREDIRACRAFAARKGEASPEDSLA